MSIHYLEEIVRALEGSKTLYACPGRRPNSWEISSNMEKISKLAKQTATHKRSAVSVMELMLSNDASPEDMFLVPTKIGEEGPGGAPQIQWSQVDTADAAEMMRDMRHGASPYFATRVVETIS